MLKKAKMPLSGNSMAWAGRFVNRTKTNRSHTYNKKIRFYLVHKSYYGNRCRRTCERNLFC